MKVLVIYYSRTGNTRLLAETIAKCLNADLEEIKDNRKRTGIFGYLKCGYEAIFKKIIEIQPSNKKPEKYHLVIVGSPVWVGRLSSPVRTYLAKYGNKIKKTAFFASCSANSGKIFSQMEDLSKQPIATLEVREKEIRSKEFLKKVESFIEKVGIK